MTTTPEGAGPDPLDKISRKLAALKNTLYPSTRQLGQGLQSSDAQIAARSLANDLETLRQQVEALTAEVKALRDSR